jgi:hypothetical protein
MSVRDHARMQAVYRPASCAGAKPRNDGVDGARQARDEKLGRKGEGDTLMLQIALSHRLRVRQEQGSNHFRLQGHDSES